MLLRLSELLFIEVVRRYLESLTGEHVGWLAGLRDPIAGHALALLHNRPADPWSLARLAREIGVSRSSLAERFSVFVGQPPMRYLTRWRIQLACRLLRDDAAKVSAVAIDVGYQSEAAFSRAFKAVVGTSPPPGDGGTAPFRGSGDVLEEPSSETVPDIRMAPVATRFDHDLRSHLNAFAFRPLASASQAS